MDFTTIDTTIFNLNRGTVNKKVKKYKRIISIEARIFSDFRNSQFSHYSVLLDFIMFQFFSVSNRFAQKDQKRRK